MDTAADYAIVGGGLAGALTAVALAERHAGARVLLLERDARLGGNHTWCCHESDLDPSGAAWLAPFVAHQWEGYDVRFPGAERRLTGRYLALTSREFAAAVHERLTALGATVLTGVEATIQGAHRVDVDGARFTAALVLDARGPDETPGGGGGYQKFLGLEVELEHDAQMARPLLMDATVPQRNGFRFIYVLPFGPRRLLVEDTCYGNDPALDVVAGRARVREWLQARGLPIARVLREETGVLPIPVHDTAAAPTGSPLRLGYRGGWFHPTTGYSLATAVTVARALAACPGPEAMIETAQALWRAHRRQAWFFRELNRLLFGVVSAGARWRLFARFYRLPAGTIERFYAQRLRAADRVRVLVGGGLTSSHDARQIALKEVS